MQVNPKTPLFGYIGRLEEQKGVDILMAALPKVLQQGQVQVVILGTGQQTSVVFVECVHGCHQHDSFHRVCIWAWGMGQLSRPL